MAPPTGVTVRRATPASTANTTSTTASSTSVETTARVRTSSMGECEHSVQWVSVSPRHLKVKRKGTPLWVHTACKH